MNFTIYEVINKLIICKPRPTKHLQDTLSNRYKECNRDWDEIVLWTYDRFCPLLVCMLFFFSLFFLFFLDGALPLILSTILLGVYMSSSIGHREWSLGRNTNDRVSRSVGATSQNDREDSLHAVSKGLTFVFKGWGLINL